MEIAELKKEFDEKIAAELMKELGIKNPMAVPKLQKIVVNSGVGEAKNKADLIDAVLEDIKQITGQMPVVTKSKAAISNFKIREGLPIGVKVTLRGKKMWYFIEKLIHIVLPRIKDFRGLSSQAFDGKGNYNFGLKDQTVFPEIDPAKIAKFQGLQITISTSADDNDSARLLLTKLGFPFKR